MGGEAAMGFQLVMHSKCGQVPLTTPLDISKDPKAQKKFIINWLYCNLLATHRPEF